MFEAATAQMYTVKRQSGPWDAAAVSQSSACTNSTEWFCVTLSSEGVG